MQFFNANILQKMAKRTGFIQRNQSILPEILVPSLISALSKGNCHAIADLHRQFNGMCLTETMMWLTSHSITSSVKKPFLILFSNWFSWLSLNLPASNVLNFRRSCLALMISCFTFHVHIALADVYPSRFKRNPAAIECHMTMSLRTFNPTAISITADTA